MGHPDPADATTRLSAAISEHGGAISGVLRDLAAGNKVDIAATTAECLGRAARTTAQFVLYWDNFATMLAADATPTIFGPAPVGGPNCSASVTLPGAVLGGPAPATGLRRRGTETEAVKAGDLHVSTDSTGALVVTIVCAGLERGVYEGFLNLDAGGNPIDPYNIYVNTP